MTSNRCVNFSCPSDSNAKLIQARECVCMYYNVPFKSNQMVCRVCLKECILMYKKMGEQIKNKESILENKFPKFFETIVLSESDEEDNVASTSYEHPQESQFSDALETIFKKMNINNLMEVQKKHFQDYVEAQKSSINAADKEISNMAEEIENIFDSVYKELYKYDNSRNFKFQEEVNIIEIDEVDIANIDEGGNIVHNEDEVHTNDKRDESSLYLPHEEILETCLLKSGDKVYAKKLSQLQPWYEATVLSIVGDMFFRISFCDNSEQYVSYNNLAYTLTMKEEYQIGNRVIAKFKDVDVKMTNNFYPGIIAELPNNFNNKRYMIFFIDGYTQYAYHEDIRLLCHQSPELSDDIHENVKKFIKAYLDKYPDIPMVHFNKNQLVRTELDTKWYLAKVINIDTSLVQLKFLDFENMHTEWIFRGSYRLGPIYNHINKIQEKRMHYIKTANVNKILNRPYIEFGYTTENLIRIDCNESNSIEDSCTIDFINIPSSRPKPVIYKDHQCNHFCMIWVNYDVSQTKNLNTLSIPLHFGFQRHMVKDESQELKTVKYTTPCGRSISNENEMYNYLKIVGYGENQMTIDLFNFDHNVDPLAVFKVTKYYKNIYDITNGKEFKPVSAVNCVNNSIPPSMKYITKCEPKPGVKLNLNAKFLCGCDCTDNCDDKRKCFCWKLTLDSVKNYPKIFKNQNIGYNYKRLHEPVYTGIYECNINCRCLKTCSNRVVQEPFATSLQLFLTEKKGWGVRTLADIPKGAFICTFVGEICTEADAEKKVLSLETLI